jgi:adenosine kinase
MRILVSGSLAYDRIMDFPGRFADHILPDKIHILNVCFTINGLRENYGGTAGNIAYALALLGESPEIVAAAGRDFGPYREWLRRHGIADAAVAIIDDELTAGAYITTDLSDNQITAFNPGAMKHRAPFDAGAVQAGEALAIVAPGNLDDMRELCRAWKERGVPHLFDPGQSLPAWSGEELVEMIRGSHIFITNDYELELTTDKTGLPVEALAALTGHLITTRGEAGSIVRRAGGGKVTATHIPVVPPTAVKDPTGAGDAYRAGLLKGLALGREVVEAARLGATCAAWAVEVYGTQTYRFTPAEFNERHRSVFGQPAW